MDIFDAPLAIITFLGLVMVAPAWFWMLRSYPAVDQLDPASVMMLNLLFPALALLTLASWIEGGAST